MSFSVTINFDTAADAAQFLMDFDSPQADATESTQKRGRGRPRKDAAAAPAPAPVPTPAVPATAAVAPPATPPTTAPVSAAAEAPAVPFAALVDPLTALADKDLDAALAILGKFGVKKASDLKPEQYGQVLLEVQAKLNPAATARPSLI